MAMRFEKLLEAVPDALVGMDQKGMIRFVNRQTESLFGYDRDQLIGRHIDMLVPETLWQIYAQHRKDYFADPRTRSSGLDLELSGRHHNGGEFPIHVSMSSIDTGDVLLVVAGVGDVATQQRAVGNAGLAEAIVEYSDDAIVGLTIDGTVTSWNPAAARMYGYSPKEVIGRPDRLIPQERAGELEAVLARIRDGHHVEHAETTLVRKDGTAVPVSITAAPIRDESGTVVGVSTVHRDVSAQRQAFEATRRLASIVEYSQDAIISGSLDGKITSWNPAAERLFGYSSKDVVGKPASLLVPKDRSGEFRAVLGKVNAGDHVKEFETMRVRKDGTVFPISLTVSPTRDADGVIIGTSVIYRDLTAQRLAEQALQHERDLLRATMDSLMDPHVLHEAVRDEAGKIVDFVYVDANPAACAYNGMDYEHLVGARLLDVQPGIIAYGLFDRYVHVVETGEPLVLDDIVYAQELRGGQERHYDVRAARVGDGLSYTWRDVTDRHVVAARLAESQDRYRLLAENASDVVFLAGSDRRIMWMAPSVTAALGWDPAELVGTEMADLFRPDFKIATVQDRVELYAKGHDVSPEGGFLFQLRTKSGDYRWMSGHEHALTDPDGSPVGVVGGLRDVTDLVKARQEAQGLSKALTTSNDSLREFVAVASHDLRSPLVTIGGFTRILMDNWSTLSDEDRLKELGAIGRGVDRLSLLTDDLLTSAKVEAGADPARPEHVRLTTALASYLEVNREGLGAVAVTCPPELVAVVDPAHLIRILDNYLTNAFKYGEPPICIEAERVGDFVEVRVRDQGPGVPPELVPRLFTKFDRGDTQATRATQGTGLGLSIVKGLAEANHGDVSYQRNEPKGGCFVVRLPAAVA